MENRSNRLRWLVWGGWPLFLLFLLVGSVLYGRFVMEWPAVSVEVDSPLMLLAVAGAVLLGPPAVFEFVAWARRRNNG